MRDNEQQRVDTTSNDLCRDSGPGNPVEEAGMRRVCSDDFSLVRGDVLQLPGLPVELWKKADFVECHAP